MKILIIGLGLMGGAYAYKLTNKGHIVYGIDKSIDAINYAKSNNYIKDGSTDVNKFISSVDVIIYALYPAIIPNYIKENNIKFLDNQLVSDIAGVKHNFINEVKDLVKPASYISHHPMAGSERSGVENSTRVNFSGANFIITPLIEDMNNPKIDLLKKIGEDLEFKRITIIDVIKHDKMIAFTSQLAHAIAVSLVNSDKDNDTKNFIGDSYRDLTRIAMINEVLWSELFFSNKDFLIEKISLFENELDKLKNALINDDKNALCDIFISSTKKRKEMEK